MTDIGKKNDTTRVISMTQFEFQLELDKVRLEQKAIDDEQLPLIKETYYNAGYETAKNKMIDKACEVFSRFLQIINQKLDKKHVGVRFEEVGCMRDFRKEMEEE